jgi:hypothetical protein
VNVTICGPNLPRALSEKGTLHVHKTGCADLRKYPKGLDQIGWPMDADTIHEVIMEIYPPDNFDYDDTNPGEYATYRSDVYVAPCVTLPEEAWNDSDADPSLVMGAIEFKEG